MSTLRITRVRKTGNGLLCKKISLGDDGEPVSDGSPCRMSNGTAQRVEIVTGAAGLADCINSLDRSEALTLGDHVAEAEEVKLVLDEAADPSKGLYSRAARFFRYHPGKPAVVLIDYDQKAMPPAVAERIEGLGGFEAALAYLLPRLGTYARVVRSSTSAGLYNKETNERFPGSGGMHLYLLVQDGADIPRFLRDLQARAWLSGLGWIMIGKRGARLVRSIIDVTVGTPERLVFEGPPLVVAPLAQDEETRKPIAYDGDLVDTRAACPPLTDDERRQYEQLVATAKGETEPAVGASIEKAVQDIAEARGIPHEAARAVVTASLNGTLVSWDEVQFDDPEIDLVQVSDILANPAKFHGKTLADPMEGRDYGQCKAKLYFNGGGDVRINSFAHGSAIYRLLHCAGYIATKVEEAGEKAPDVLAALIPFTTIETVNSVDGDRLRTLAAEVGKVNKRPVNEMVKQALAKARAAEREHRARSAARRAAAGGKQRDVREKLTLLAGERLAAMREIERALLKPANVRAGSVLARGQTTAVLRFATDPIKLREGKAEIEMPAGSAYLAPAKPEHLQAQLDGLFAFSKFNSDGEEYATDCPSEMARYTLANANLLPVTSISRTPVIRADGSIVETLGYDPATGIILAPDEQFPPVPPNPTQEDAAAALKRLRQPFRAFPFVTETDRDAVIGEALTVLTRHLVQRAPAFLHSANEAGSGKTKLFDTVSMIVLGTAAPLMNAEVLRDETELRKLLTTLTLGAAPFAVFDNAPRGEELRSAGLANYLTATVYGDRLLGANEEVKAPTSTVIGITGNSVDIVGDLTRRIFRIDLDPECERPETRAFEFDSEAEARRDRGELVVAALTILKAHALAGWPTVEGRAALGSFEDWDKLVAGAIKFAGGDDIVKLLDKARTVDPERSGLAEVLRMLDGIGAVVGHGKRAGEIIASVRKRADATIGDDEAEEWMAILRRLGKDGVPDPTRLGRFLGKNAGRVVGGGRLNAVNDSHAKVKTFYVERMANAKGKSAGVAGLAGVDGGQFLREVKIFDDANRVNNISFRGNGCAGTPASPASPANGHASADVCRICREPVIWPKPGGITFGDGSQAHDACHVAGGKPAVLARREPVF